jgi:O-glycosyl hydrolase
MMKKLIFALSVTFAVLFTVTCGVEQISQGDAAKPRITRQPQVSASYLLGDTITPLAVRATVSDGGKLSYQWFSYSANLDYLNSTGTKIEGATKASYTPVFEREGVYGFYVIVTNTNNKTAGKLRISVKSEAATINVNDPNNAKFPLIIKQPTSEPEYILTRSLIINLVVDAEAAEERDILSYEWYEANSLTNENGDLLPTATAPQLTPSITEPGTHYYFAVVTNTNYMYSGRQKSSVASDPVEVKVVRNPDALAPEITVQPQSRIYFSTDTLLDLTVDAAEPEDDGVLTYQWYSNTTNSNTGGTLITGETRKTYTPPVSLDTQGRYYYYAVVTNTNTEVERNKIVTTASKVAILSVQTAGGLPSTTVNVGVDFGTKYQYVRGFGGMDVAWGNFPSYSFADYEKMFNPDELGYNLLRIMILPNYTDIKRTMAELVGNKLSGNEDRSNFYEFVKVVNKYNGYVLASPWTPPAAWKNNNSIIGNSTSAYLRLSNYPNFANYLKTFCKIMSDNGAPIYVVSTANEPTYSSNYDGCRWTPEANRNFFAQQGHFTDGVPGYGGGRPLTAVLTMDGESHNEVQEFHEPALMTQQSRNNIDIVGRHTYGAITGATDQSYYARAQNPVSTLTATGTAWNPAATIASPGWVTDAVAREIWMTEKNINGANDAARLNDSTWPWVWEFMNDIDFTIRHSRENGYIWWSLKRFYSMLGDGTLGTTNSVVYPRGHGLSHYAKFAKETGRVGVTVTGAANVNPTSFTASTGPKITAHVTLKDGIVAEANVVPRLGPAATAWNFGRNSLTIDDVTAISLVMYTPTNQNASGTGGTDLGSITITLPTGFTIGNAEAMRSNATAQSVMEGVTIGSDRRTAVVNLPAGEILSVRFTR